MKNFIKFLLEANDIVPYAYPQVKGPHHKTHPVGQFLQFIHDELPHAGDEYSIDNQIREHMGGHIKRILGDDPTHFTNFYKGLTTDEEGNNKEADLYDVLYDIGRQAKDSVFADMKKKSGRSGVSEFDFGEIHDRTDSIRKHLEKEAERAIVRTAKTNPKFKHIDSLMDIKI
jgi:hypothetical protein